MTPRLNRWSKPKLEAALRRFAIRHGRFPYHDECLQANDLPPRPALIGAYGSLAAAIRAAGGTPPPRRARLKAE
jgi:hypothetical protein